MTSIHRAVILLNCCLMISSAFRASIHRHPVRLTAASSRSTSSSNRFLQSNNHGILAVSSQHNVNHIHHHRSILSRRGIPSSLIRRSSTSDVEEEAAAATNNNNNNNNDDGSTYQIKSTSYIDTHYDAINKSNGLSGTTYDPSSFESKVYNWWEKSGCFDPDCNSSKATTTTTKREPYVLPMPPPNVTGRLHMGHAIFVALQDVLARFHRMRGKAVLWTPGTDHAGIATQLQVKNNVMLFVVCCYMMNILCVCV